MIGTTNCVYETPCGWCSKWDKECDKKMHTKSYRIKNPKPITKSVDDFPTDMTINRMCASEADHEWECCCISTAGTNYRCKKCGAYKVYPL